MHMRTAWIVTLLGLGLMIGALAATASESTARALLAPGFAMGATALDAEDFTRVESAGGTASTSGESTGIWFGAVPALPQSPSLAVEETWLDPVLTLSRDNIPTLSTVTLDASGSRSSSGIILFEWDLDGDDVFDAATNEPTYEIVYEQDGVRALRVRVTDLRGNTATSAPIWLP